MSCVAHGMVMRTGGAWLGQLASLQPGAHQQHSKHQGLMNRMFASVLMLQPGRQRL